MIRDVVLMNQGPDKQQEQKKMETVVMFVKMCVIQAL